MSLLRHIFQIVARHQWGSQHTPHGEMGTVFVNGHTAVSNLKHIRIVPMPRTGILAHIFLHIQNFDNSPVGVAWMFLLTVETPGNIAGCPPQMSNFGSPFPWFASTPFAKACLLYTSPSPR